MFSINISTGIYTVHAVFPGDLWLSAKVSFLSVLSISLMSGMPGRKQSTVPR